MDIQTGRKLVGNLSMGMMLGAWRHICKGHLPDDAEPGKSKFLHAAKDYEKIIDLIWRALGKSKGATGADIYKDSQDDKVAIVIGTFEEGVGKSSAAAAKADCKHVFCILQGDKGDATKTIFKSSYPARNISATRFTKLGPVTMQPAPPDPRLAALM